MQGPFAGLTDPTPFIVAAYFIGISAFIAVPALSLWATKKSERLLDLIKNEEPKA